MRITTSELIYKIQATLIGNILTDIDNDPALIDPTTFIFPELRELFDMVIEAREKEEPRIYMAMKLIELGKSDDLLNRCEELAITSYNFKHNLLQLDKIMAAKELQEFGEHLSDTTVTGLETNLDKMREILDRMETKVVDDLKLIRPEQIEIPLEDRDGSQYIPTGFEVLDDALNELGPGRVTLISGRSHEGKSTFARQLIANAMIKRKPTLWVIGESTPQDELESLYSIVIGNDPSLYTTLKDNRVYRRRPTQETRKALNRWHDGMLWILSKSDARLKSTDELLYTIQRNVRQIKPRLIVIDNLMSVLNSSALEKNEAQGAFMQKLCDLAKLNRCHVILILHPNKQYQQGQRMAYEHLSGSSDLFNKADSLLVVRKATEQDKKKYGDIVDALIDIEKNRHNRGILTTATAKFDAMTGALYEIGANGKPIVRRVDISKYMDVKLNFYNGESQIIEDGKGWRSELNES